MSFDRHTTTTDALNGKTGLYLEDCRVSETASENMLEGGYGPHAYDMDGAAKLLELSNELLETDY